MSVIITEMDMPKDCGECDLRVTLRFKNNLINFCPKTMKNVELNEMHNECPLKEISPHGRLIDADAHIKLLKENHCGERCRRNHNCFSCGIDMYIRIVENEPTVIKAEGVNE